MKSVLMSIKPKYVEFIASGKKTIEVRKTRPKIETPFKCYIYETKGKKVECGFHFEETGRTLREKFVFGMHEARIVKHYRNEGKQKVIGEFTCDRIDEFLVFENGSVQYWNCYDLTKSCITYNELANYIGKNKKGYAWNISDLVIYDKPKSLEMFPIGKIARDCGCGGYIVYDKVLTRPPNSWCYVEKGE